MWRWPQAFANLTVICVRFTFKSLNSYASIRETHVHALYHCLRLALAHSVAHTYNRGVCLPYDCSEYALLLSSPKRFDALWSAIIRHIYTDLCAAQKKFCEWAWKWEWEPHITTPHRRLRFSFELWTHSVQKAYLDECFSWIAGNCNRQNSDYTVASWDRLCASIKSLHWLSIFIVNK